MVETRCTIASSASSITSRNTSSSSGRAAPSVPFTTMPVNSTVLGSCADARSSVNGAVMVKPAMMPAQSQINRMASIVPLGQTSEFLHLGFDLDFRGYRVGAGLVFVS